MASFGQSSGVVKELPDELVTQANDLYWNSDASVNRLAQELDLSKGALYEIIAPFPAGLPCPRGDGELGYSNRTARDRGFVSCSECGLEDEEDRVRERLAHDGYTPELDLPTAHRGRPDRRLEKLVFGSALVGMAAGLILAGVFRRR